MFVSHVFVLVCDVFFLSLSTCTLKKIYIYVLIVYFCNFKNICTVLKIVSVKSSDE